MICFGAFRYRRNSYISVTVRSEIGLKSCAPSPHLVKYPTYASLRLPVPATSLPSLAAIAYVGYFTKWGDGAHDFNPISDLTVTEIYEFLRYLNAPKHIIEKAPSAALFDGQTDESEMGVTYAELDAVLCGKEIPSEKRKIIDKLHHQSEHKRKEIAVYGK